ncbi:bifunctional biotin--[acetyl-CoA-carboxylase] ligase/biotin operon repressor BirA [Nitrincola sp.]|uniref:bifunctional biotin--[acetyl-CoA-carboxylase] ligase/biotin operon repressor BirA n=1 Tax=Nitrincola sp. TaxID=1926584 RepID=UPI003A8E7BEC
MTRHSLLTLLADGAFHSGRELGEALQISRTAVWKQVKLLEAMGLEVFSIRGRGYRIPGGVDLIELDRLNSLLGSTSSIQLDEIDLRLSTGSTNELALEGLRRGVHRALYVAEQQTAGRGRRGRQWISPLASGLYFSLAWRFRCGVTALEGLSLAVGLALKRALDQAGYRDVGVKWPNDLLVGGKKLAGVLIEVTGDTAIESQLVIGIGLNTGLREAEADAIDQQWSDLHQQGLTMDRTELLVSLLVELIPVLQEFERDGFKVFREEWLAADIFRNKPVRVQTGAEAYITGIAAGVNETGALLLQTERELRILHGGEVSLRPV